MKINRTYLTIILTLVFIGFALFLFQNCANGNNGNSGEQLHNMEKKRNPGHIEDKDEHHQVKLKENEIKEFGIIILKAGPGTIREHIDLTGEIIMDPGRIAHIKPRFSGIVKTVRKGIGDHVKKGETMAVIESNESLVNYKLTSSIEGVVIDMHMTPGENVGDDFHSITVADISVLWANLSVYQKDLIKIKKGQIAYISAGNVIRNFKCTIDYISPVFNESTRTVSARVILENINKMWKPGIFINAKVITEERKVDIAINNTALTIIDGKNVVFVKTDGKFIPLPVTIGMRNEKNAEIVSGLSPGQEYVSEGVFILKAELEKESFGDEH